MPFFRRKNDSTASSKTSSKHSSPVSSPSPKLTRGRNHVATPDGDEFLQLPPGGARSKSSTSSTPNSMSRSASFQEQSGDLASYSHWKDLPMPNTSRLSKTLNEVLHDKDALGYFIQYMESRDAVRFIRFWLDAESFQAATWTRIRSHSLNAMSQSCVTKSPNRTSPQKSPPPSGGTANHVSGSPSNDGDSEDPLGEKLRKCVEKDAVAIYSRYISLDATKPIGISDELRNETIRKICCEDGRVDPLCFVECQDFAFRTMNAEYFDQFTMSEFHCQHQVDILTSGDVRLADILYNEQAVFYFMELVEREGGSNLLQFLMNVDNFEDILVKSQGGYDGLQAQGDAMVLYEKYFSLQASTPLGFDDKIRFEIESNICREGGPLPQCFQPARSIVLAYIENRYFKIYQSSDIYLKFLSELISASNSQGECRRKRCGSDDASSDHSAPSAHSGDARTKNTLLAADERKRVVNLKEGDFRIDMGSIINPQSLYQRNVGKLSLGHVNSMGHFVSDFDREPDHTRKPEGYFAKKKREQDRTQEDMALKIAQMIINDVTSLTADEDDDS